MARWELTKLTHLWLWEYVPKSITFLTRSATKLLVPEHRQGQEEAAMSHTSITPAAGPSYTVFIRCKFYALWLHSVNKAYENQDLFSMLDIESLTIDK